MNDLSRVALPSPVITGGLAPDSNADGNGVVLKSQVTITGQTQPNLKVRLTLGSATNVTTDLRSVADAQG